MVAKNSLEASVFHVQGLVQAERLRDKISKEDRHRVQDK